MELINQYSMLWSSVLVLVVAAYFVLRKGSKSGGGIKLLVLAVVLFGGWLILRPQQATTSEFAQFQSELGQDKAVLLELQSPF